MGEKHVWREPFDVLTLRAHKDPRGMLFEILRFEDHDVPAGGQLYTFSIEPGARRGDHYHERKREWFTCVHGEAEVLLTASDGREGAFLLRSDEPSVVYAGPGTSHALINRGEALAVIVSYGSTQHDPEDPDTIRKRAYPGYGDER
jgi:UDP-2-acetamido-2,6-beta-L-arabino-hexul-4-ose reductase